MAVWALEELGLQCIVAESYGDIFFNNCLQNGLLPITLDSADIDELAKIARSGGMLTVDLQACIFSTEATEALAFAFPAPTPWALPLGHEGSTANRRLREHGRQQR